MDLQLRYPKKSHRKAISLPEDSVDLAELMGIEFGDGGINNPWQLVITLNSEADREYSIYVSELLTKLFHIQVSIRKRPHGKVLVLVCSSSTLLDFLIVKGAVRGNKILQQIDIPTWINHSTTYQRAFVRGLVDTDGCLYIHRHRIKGKEYRHVGLCFTSFSLPLTKSVAKIFLANGIQPHVTDSGRRIYLYNQNLVIQYLKIFGSSNSRILNKFSEWRDG
ncbi:MAG: LAGLIDADG family homing endonuclease [Candidatus Woesebacteria bacterium]